MLKIDELNKVRMSKRFPMEIPESDFNEVRTTLNEYIKDALESMEGECSCQVRTDIINRLKPTEYVEYQKED